MEKNSDGKSIINIDCFCQEKGCYGNLYIQPDKVNGTKVFIVTVVGTSGAEQGYMWLSVEQLEQLKNELSVVISEYYGI